jgi:hypothetical protein
VCPHPLHLKHWIQTSENDSSHMMLRVFSSAPVTVFPSKWNFFLHLFPFLADCLFHSTYGSWFGCFFSSKAFLNELEIRISLLAQLLLLDVRLCWRPSEICDIFFRNPAIFCPMLVDRIQMSVPSSSEVAVWPLHVEKCASLEKVKKSVWLKTFQFNGYIHVQENASLAKPFLML